MIDRKPVSVTFFEYERGDIIGFCLAYSSLLPVFLIVSYTAVILARRELIIVFTLIGQLLNEVLNAIIKNVIKQPRPIDSPVGGYGMPSSHAQFMFFFSTYCILYMFMKLKMKNDVWKYLLSAALIGASLVVSYSRYYLSYHTIKQVCVGIIIGICSGTCWFFIVDCLIRPKWFRGIIEHPLSRFLLIQDSENIDNVFVWEYEERMKHYFNQTKKD
ncbi:PAP2-domain-containing protein [Anaeromyces robustus]|uniref:Dolichyldiphosphatase n=1 Tax=Anaeromyces robustus TaxID=1754192 RepID=A0A1Y1XNA9_9FUNG|nr:PAP2-domain-containing protein [Anaeromyces robustus]|eukprot:ORX86986.1 PAP2-domain-containing protein [Anaeromyces robustus]